MCQAADGRLFLLKLRQKHLHQFFFRTGGTCLGEKQVVIVSLPVRQQGETFWQGAGCIYDPAGRRLRDRRCLTGGAGSLQRVQSFG